MKPRYHEQVALLLRILSVISKENKIALHGGSAINLFYQEMPRLSVDIDLTYLSAGDRNKDLAQIKALLIRLNDRLLTIIPGINIKGPGIEADEYKLYCTLGRAMVKIEINTINRGVHGQTKVLPLCAVAQKEFNMFCEIQVVPLGQLYGGKIVAALDRQHPRDLFDIRAMFRNYGYSDEIQCGFIFCLLSSKRPFHELLQPARIDQRKVLESQFSGMTDEVFTYEMFEKTRDILIQKVNHHLSDTDKSLLSSFAAGEPEWADFDFSAFPGVRWKLMNINILKKKNINKFTSQLDKLKEVLQFKT